jgi:hypothetical protein
MCDIESKENILKAAEYCVQNSVCSGCVLRTDYHCKERLAEYLLALKIENTNLSVENEVLKRDRDNLERTLEEANEEIADYQSKVENGYLVELPCKVGDSICSFRLNGDKKLYVYSGKVNQIVFNTKGILIRSSVFRDFYYEEPFGDLSEPYIDMQKFYLCSKEGAEEKAKRCKVE